MQCPACGQMNHTEWYFCAGCGGSLDAVRVASQQASPAIPPAAQPVLPAFQPGRPQASAPAPAAPPPPQRQTVIPMPFQPTLQPAYGAAAPYQVNVYVQNHLAPAATVAVPAPAAVVGADAAPTLLVRIVWFLCIGLWLGMLTTFVSWALIVSVLGLPLGLMLLNRMPKIMTLRPTRRYTRIEPYAGGFAISQGGPPQRSLPVRAVYFLAVGWWLSALWLMAAWAFAGLTFGLGLPLAFWMFNRVGAITTLARH